MEVKKNESKKDNKIVKNIEKLCDFYSDIYTVIGECKRNITDVRIKNANKELTEINNKEKLEVKQLEIKQLKKIKTFSFVFLIASLITSVCSTFTSIMGICDDIVIGNFVGSILSSSKNIGYAMFMIVGQTIVIIYTMLSPIIQKKFYGIYRISDVFSKVFLVLSIVTNYWFLEDLLKPNTIIYQAFVFIFSCILDVATVMFSLTSMQFKYKMYSYKAEFEDSFANTLNKRFKEYFNTNKTAKPRLVQKPVSLQETHTDKNVAIEEQVIKETIQKAIAEKNKASGLAEENQVKEEKEVPETKISKLRQPTKVTRNDNSIENARKHIFELESGSMVKVKDLHLTKHFWDTLREELVEENVVYIKGKITYRR